MKTSALWLPLWIAGLGLKTCTTSSILRSNCTNNTRKPWYQCWFSNKWRRAKFPIRPPRLRRPTTTTTPASTTTIHTTPAPITVILSTESLPDLRPNDAALQFVDNFEQSSSNNRPAVAWPTRRRQSLLRFWSSLTPSTTQSTPRPPPKLLLPRPTRPAMYSLDGFVPKPSTIRITTTEAPPHIKAQYEHLFQPQVAESNRVSQKYEEVEKSPKGVSTRFGSSHRKTERRHRGYQKLGIPGQDYPVYNSIPDTSFDCRSQSGPGMYADTETGCQIWHVCPGISPRRYSFMCPNKTIFNEEKQVCDWWYNVECNKDSRRKFRRRFGREAKQTTEESESSNENWHWTKKNQQT